MNEHDKNQEPEVQEFDLEDIMREFGSGSETPAQEDAPAEVPAEALPAEEEVPAPQSAPAAPVTGDTVRVELPQSQPKEAVSGETVRLGNLEDVADAPTPQEDKPEEAEPFSENWQPEFEQPMGEYVPPQPILFHPRSKLRELKRKLVAGPEKRYYELSEIGFGKLQMAMFLCFLLVVLSVGTTLMYALGNVQEARLKLMVFCQLFVLMFAALLGSYQMIEGVADLFRGRFSLNTLLIFSFIACCADGFLCLQEQRIPCCAAFSIQVFMSLWSTYHKRNTEMAMMDTLRKATTLNGIKSVKDYYDGCDGLLRGEGQVEDVMDHYRKPSAPEKVMSWFALLALLVSAASGILAWYLHDSVSFGIQVFSASLLAAVPGTAFITLSRPMALVERRLHRLGAVLCGWRGIVGLSKRAVFPLTNEDLFPVGCCKLNGVKYYSHRDPDQVVAYCAALANADGGSLVPLFEHLVVTRGAKRYTAQNVRAYNGGIGGEVCGVSVLMGTLNCLKELGVEIPAGSSVSQAVYAAIDGELCGVFAVVYARTKSSATGMRTLCGYRGLRPTLVSGEFMLTEAFVKSRFNINIRKVCFPQRSVRADLAAVTPDPEEPALALITTKGLAPYAFSVTGARSVRSASWIGLTVHLLGGVLGLAILAVLAYCGRADLVTPANLLLYVAAWMIPGYLTTEWPRSL